MYKPESFDAGDTRQQPSHAWNGLSQPQNNPPFRRPAHQQWGGQRIFSHHYRDRPPGSLSTRPNFIVQLRTDSPRMMEDAETREIVQKITHQPQKFNVLVSAHIAGTLLYEQWSETLETVVQLWEMKLNGNGHNFLPRVICNIDLPSDKAELDTKLRPLFLEKLKGLLVGNSVQKWMKKLGDVEHEIKRVSDILRKPKKIGICNELWRKKEGLEDERDLIFKRVQEFKSGVKRIVSYLNDGEAEEECITPIFHFSDADIEWGRIYRLMMRECQRLDDGLPIYAYRQDILKQIQSHQVVSVV